MYFIAQLLGAIIGACFLEALAYVSLYASDLCTPKPAPIVSVRQLFGYELFITFVLVMTVFATCDSGREIGGSGPLAIGIAVAMCHLWAVRTGRIPCQIRFLKTLKTRLLFKN